MLSKDFATDKLIWVFFSLKSLTLLILTIIYSWFIIKYYYWFFVFLTLGQSVKLIFLSAFKIIIYYQNNLSCTYVM